MAKLIDLTGKVYGRLTVISFAGHKKDRTCWNCVCLCGCQKKVRSYHLTMGLINSCGCLLGEKHGDSSGSKEYDTWTTMKSRCNNLRNKRYLEWGGRGITVCERWINSYSNFLADMGRAPSAKHSIDRIQNNKGYYPSNCRWATLIEQANNKRNNKIIQYKGKSLTLSEWCRKLNLKYYTILARLNYGWTVTLAFETPVRNWATQKRV